MIRWEIKFTWQDSSLSMFWGLCRQVYQFCPCFCDLLIILDLRIAASLHPYFFLFIYYRHLFSKPISLISFQILSCIEVSLCLIALQIFVPLPPQHRYCFVHRFLILGRSDWIRVHWSPASYRCPKNYQDCSALRLTRFLNVIEWYYLIIIYWWIPFIQIVLYYYFNYKIYNQKTAVFNRTIIHFLVSQTF